MTKITLTIFSSCRPFTVQFDSIQRNAIKSWLSLSPRPEIILIGREKGVSDVCHEFGLSHISVVEENNQGIPLVSSIFLQAKANASHQIMCYVNTDIILMQDFIESIEIVSRVFPRFLIICNRWDMDMARHLNFSNEWEKQLKSLTIIQGKPNNHIGSDLFVLPKKLFMDMPPFITGRPVWDNWMIYKYRSQKIPVIDISERTMIIHQNHNSINTKNENQSWDNDRRRNLQLAGGYGYSYTSFQATHKLTAKGIIPNISYARFYYETNRFLRRMAEHLRRKKITY